MLLAVVGAGLYVYMRRLPEPVVHNMKQPLWMQPDIVAPGGLLTVHIKAGQRPEIERVLLNNTVSPEELEYKVKVENLKFDAEQQMAIMTVRVPKLIPEALYDLSVWYHEGPRLMHQAQINSVKVQARRKGTFTFAVVSQFVFHSDVDNPARRRNEMRALFEELNIMNPDFIVVPGGISGSFWTSPDDVTTFFDLVRKYLTVPLYLLPNEDDIGRVTLIGRELRPKGILWRRVAGPRHFRFTHEGIEFVGVDTFSCQDRKRNVLKRSDTAPGCISESELKWLKKQLEDVKKKHRAVFLFSHHSPANKDWINDEGVKFPVFERKSQTKMLKLIQQYDVPVVFSGHVQRDTMQRVGKGDTIFVSQGSGGRLTVADKPALRLVTVVKGKLSADNISYVNKPASVPLGKVTATFRVPNDGGTESNTITVNNGLKRPLVNMSLCAMMARKGDNSEYDVSGGDAQILQTFGSRFQYVFLTFHLTPGEKRIFEIK